MSNGWVMVFFALCGALVLIISVYCWFDSRARDERYKHKAREARDAVIRRRLSDYEHLEGMMRRIVDATVDPDRREAVIKQFYVDNPPPRLEE